MLHLTNDGQILDANGDPYFNGGAEQDSVFNSEVYAQSFVVTQDGTVGSATAHITSDGDFESYGPTSTTTVDENGARIHDNDNVSVTGFSANGLYTFDSQQNGHQINEDGAWTAYQNGGVPTAGLDAGGEIFARSFYIKDPSTGSILGHWNSDGSFGVLGGENERQTTLYPGEIHVDIPDDGQFNIDSFFDVFVELDVGLGLQLGSVLPGQSNPLNLFKVYGDGTWTSTQNGNIVGGLDSSGEIFAASFYVRDPVTSETLLHLTNDGQILDGNGDPYFTPGEQDSTFNSEVYAKSFMVTTDG
ncbi:MAG: hypothetical protein GY869_22380, partial [Planctomycetes bacterium]|nr:hypothetical protein [Planctomycetota bacterium]